VTTAVFAILSDATRLGVTLHVRGTKIVAHPRSALTADLAAAINRHRADVLSALALAISPPPTPCWSCRGTRFFARLERLTWICARCHPPADASAVIWHEVAAVSRDG
jgi:hypothetical protein